MNVTRNLIHYLVDYLIIIILYISGIKKKNLNKLSMAYFICIIMRIKDIIKLIEKDGWYLHSTRGSHRQYKHPTKPGRVTIAGKLSDDIAPGTLNSILKQAQLKE